MGFLLSFHKSVNPIQQDQVTLIGKVRRFYDQGFPYHFFFPNPFRCLDKVLFYIQRCR